jgi:hypothetical protein
VVRHPRSTTLAAPAAAPPDVGGLSGGGCVLHTWSRTRPARPSSVGPVRALAQRCRGRLLALVRQARPDPSWPEAAWTNGGGVYGQPALHSTETVLPDLGRDGPPPRADQEPDALPRERPRRLALSGCPGPALEVPDPAGAGVPPSRSPPVWPLPGHPGRQPASPSPDGPRIPPGVRRLTPLPPLQDHRAPPGFARMCFPRGAGCLNIPDGVTQRFRSPPCLCRLRATKTLIRSASLANEIVRRATSR